MALRTLRRLIGALACFGLIAGCACSPHTGQATSVRLSSESDLLYSLEQLRPEMQAYQCGAMVATVNGLRHLGKERALHVLEDYNRGQTAGGHQMIQRELNVVYVCRLLFIAPEGEWEEPWGSYNRNALKEIVHQDSGFVASERGKFPLYPVLLVDGVPFVVNMGYFVSWQGPAQPTLPNEARTTLDKCRSLDLIRRDLPSTGFGPAALSLLNQIDKKSIKLADEDTAMFRYLILKETIERSPLPPSSPVLEVTTRAD